MIAISDGTLEGTTFSPGSVCAPLRRFTRPDRINRSRALSALEVATAMQELLEVASLEDFTRRRRKRVRPEDSMDPSPMHCAVLRSVETVLRNDGGNLVFAVASVLERYGEGLDHVEGADGRSGLVPLSELTERILRRLIDARQACAPTGVVPYIALIDQVSLPEAVLLPAGLSGIATKSRNKWQLAQLGRLLRIPVIGHVQEEEGGELDGIFIRLDGSAGTLYACAPPQGSMTHAV